MTHSLASQNLSAAYGSRSVLENLSVTLAEGKTTSIVGPNACGKSTLLRTLARLMKPTSGTVLLNGTCIFQQPTRQVARTLAILPQNTFSPAGMRVRDLVLKGRAPHQSPLAQWSKEDEAIVRECLDDVELADHSDRLLDELSGGQRQRAWIAMVLAQRTGILLLDEPTTFLDLPHQLDILSLIRDRSLKQGQTVVMVLHDINLAARFSDEIIAMRDHGILAHGTPEAVVTEATMQAVYGMPSVVISDPSHGTPHVIPR